MRLARIEHGPIVGGQDIVEHRGIISADGFTGACLDGAELETAFGLNGSKRAGADPGEAYPRCDDRNERQPQRDRPSALGGTMGGFGGGHLVLA